MGFMWRDFFDSLGFYLISLHGTKEMHDDMGNRDTLKQYTKYYIFNRTGIE